MQYATTTTTYHHRHEFGNCYCLVKYQCHGLRWERSQNAGKITDHFFEYGYLHKISLVTTACSCFVAYQATKIRIQRRQRKETDDQLVSMGLAAGDHNYLSPWHEKQGQQGESVKRNGGHLLAMVQQTDCT